MRSRSALSSRPGSVLFGLPALLWLCACGQGFVTGGQAGSGGSSAGGGGTGGQAGAENCTNDADDDGDDLVDCADPDCTATGFQCIEVPGGWDGPVLAAPAQDEAACPARWPSLTVTAGTGVTGTAASCGCQCDATGTLSCGTALKVGVFGNATCTAGDQQPQLQEGVCTLLTAAGPGAAVLISAPALDGACGASSSIVVQKEPPVLEEPTAVCSGAATGGGCASAVCAPGGGGSVCIVKAGIQSCPLPVYEQRVVYAGVDDTRDCTCTCAPGGPCEASVAIYQGNTCSGSTPTEYQANGTCTPIANGTSVPQLQGIASITEPTCQPHQLPSGGVAPASPYTLCCLP